MISRHPLASATPRRWLSYIALLGCLVLPATAALAQGDQPVKIQADQAEIKKDISTYTGNVRIAQGNITLHGNKLVVKRLPDNANGKKQFRLTLDGHPATIDQHAGTQAGSMHGQASRISYATTSRIIKLSGQAKLTRGNETITGKTIQYNRQARRTVVNQGTSGGRVNITLTPGKSSH